MTPQGRQVGRAGRPAKDSGRAVPRLELNLALAGCLFSVPLLTLLATQSELQRPAESEAQVAAQLVELRRAAVLEALEPVEEIIFLRHVRTRLPRYLDAFKQEAQRHRISWPLLAAQAYQESRWNPGAVSPTGVRGLMMLTQNTSSALGIENRLDPDASISGGARHLARLLRRVPASILEPDRTWVALAAYNVGMGHIKDARRLAVRLGKDHDRWSDLEQVLPLLARKKYYETLPHGYARGWEPVVYVKRIRAFQQLLHRHFQDAAVDLSPQL